MAIAYQETREHGKIRILWETLEDDDTGVPYNPPVGYNKRTVQVMGTFGSGGTVAIEGSLDESTFVSMVNFTAAGLLALTNNPLNAIMPHVTAGDDDTDLDVYITFSLE